MKKVVLIPSLLAIVFPCSVLADSTFKLCVDSNNSPPCPASVDEAIGVDEFNAKFGSTWAAQQMGIGKEFCTFTEDGVSKLTPYSIVKISDVSGGSHGTAVFSITCAK
jgi:hypothetical protein